MISSRRWRLSVGLACAAVLHSLSPAAARRAETFVLANGMRAVVIQDRRMPVVTHMVWYRVGAAEDPSGASGLAHFLEHLMFKSTEMRAAGEFSRTITRIGGRDNAFTSHDTTYYFQRVARAHLGMVMTLEAERMGGLRIIEDEVRVERDVVRAERRSRVEDNPFALLNEQMMTTLYPAHPYGRPVLGWTDELEGLTRDQAAAFYVARYAPNNATLVVAGDVSVDEVRQLAEASYGLVKARPISRRAPVADSPAASSHRVAVESERATAPSLLRLYALPGVHAIAGGAEALEVLAHVIGGDAASRLHRELVAANLAVTAGASYIAGRHSGRLALVVVPPAGVSLATAEAALDAALTSIREAGVSAADLARAKATLEARRVFDADNQMSVARLYGEGVSLDRSIADIEASDTRLAAVTVDDVARAATLMDAKRAVTGTLSPEARRIRAVGGPR